MQLAKANLKNKASYEAKMNRENSYENSARC